MAPGILPVWTENLDDEDLSFLKSFVLSSGSLKQTAAAYGVTYPTVRLRLDRLIDKIRAADREDDRSYVALVRRLALDERIDLETARLLIDEYRKTPPR